MPGTPPTGPSHGLHDSADGVFSRILQIEAHLSDLTICLCDPHPTEEQFRRSHELLSSMTQTIDHPQTKEIHDLLERLERAILSVLRFRLRFNERTRTIVDRAIVTLEKLVEARLEDKKPRNANLRQCLDSLDTLLVRAGWTKKPVK